MTLNDMKLNSIQFFILSYVKTYEGHSNRKIVDALDISEPTVRKTLRELRDLGLIVNQRNAVGRAGGKWCLK